MIHLFAVYHINVVGQKLNKEHSKVCCEKAQARACHAETYRDAGTRGDPSLVKNVPYMQHPATLTWHTVVSSLVC
jgi:hypothetical protein